MSVRYKREMELDRNGVRGVPEFERLESRLLLSGSTDAYSAEILADDPVVYYRLDSVGPRVAIDMSGNGIDGEYSDWVRSFQGLTAVPGNEAASFDRTEAYIQVPHDPLLGIQEQLTVEFWVNLDAAGSETAIRKNENDFLLDFGTENHSDPGHHAQWFIRNASGQTNMVYAREALLPGNWYHLVGTYDHVLGMQLFINGERIGGDDLWGNPTGMSGLIRNSEDFLRIGSWSSEAFLGKLDEVAIYDHVLDHQRIQSHYLAGNVGLMDPFEPNNNIEEATPVGARGDFGFTNNQVLTMFDTDVFHVDTTNATHLKAEIVYQAEARNAPFFSITDSDGERIVSGARFAGSVTLETVLPGQGDYYLQVEGVTVGKSYAIRWIAYDINAPGEVLVEAEEPLRVSEDGTSDTFTVSLSRQPSSEVMMLVGRDVTEFDVSTTQLVFTPDNWDVPQTVRVTGLDDQVVDGDVEAVVLLFRVSSDDPGFDRLAVASPAIIIEDNDSIDADVVVKPDLFTSELQDVTHSSIRNERLTLIDTFASARVLIPQDETLGLSWTGDPANEPFDDLDWIEGTSAVGYDTSDRYRSFIGTNVTTQMFERRPGVYVRIPFEVDDPDVLSSLLLQMRVDDGFVAYLNGVRIADFNVPLSVTSESLALASSDEWEAVRWRDFDVSEHLDLIGPGENILAIHGMNANVGSSDFMVFGRMLAGHRSTPHTVEIRLASQPLSDVTIPFSISDSSEGRHTLGENFIVITPENWESPPLITVAGVQDHLSDGDQVFSLQFGPAESDDLSYDGLMIEDVVFTNLDAPPGASIAGVKFEDLNGDGVADPNEPRLANRRIYVDQNRNGRFDPGEPVEMTDEDGEYRFRGLAPGRYIVADDVETGFRATVPLSRTSDTDFVTIPEGTQTTFDAYFDDGIAHLADVTGGKGYYHLNEFIAGEEVTGFEADFDLLIGGGGGEGADGVGFHFGPNAGAHAIPEVPLAVGLSLTLDTFGNTGSDVRGFDLFYNKVRIDSFGLSRVRMRNNDFDNIHINYDPERGLSLDYVGFSIFRDVKIPGFNPRPDWTFAVGARSGGFKDNHWLDHFRITADLESPGAGTNHFVDIQEPGEFIGDVNFGSVYFDDAYEPNDTVNTAHDITAANGRLLSLVDGPAVQADDDYYLIEVAEGQAVLAIAALFDHAEVDIDLEVLDENLEVIGVSASDTDDEMLQLEVTGPGQYFVRVQGDDRVGDYDLVFRAYDPNVSAGFVVEPGSVSTSEDGETDAFWLALNQRPSADVQLALLSSDSTEADIDRASLTFTADDWFIPQRIVVTGQDDQDIDGDGMFTILTNSAESLDPEFDGVDPPDVLGVNRDNELLPSVDVYVVPRRVPSSVDVSSALPGSDVPGVFYQRESEAFYLEVWARATQAQLPGTNIVGGSAMVNFDPTAATAVSVDHGTVFDRNVSSDIDLISGAVSLSGEVSGVVDSDDFVLFGRILLTARADLDPAGDEFGPFDLGVSVVEGAIPFGLDGYSEVDMMLQTIPIIQSRAVIFDFDNDGVVNFADLGLFLPAMNRLVSSSQPPYTTWADFNHDMVVNSTDRNLMLLAFGKPFEELIIPEGARTEG